MQQTEIWSLGQKDTLKEEMAIHSLTEESDGQRNLAGNSPKDCKHFDTTAHMHNLVEIHLLTFLGFQTATIYTIIVPTLSFWEKLLAISRCSEIARVW